jgi:DNA ligase-1
LKEGTLLKLKRFVDSEYEIVGFEERMHNGNEATKDELGNTKRSSHQENKVGRGDLGALVLRCDAGTFNCGTGFTDAMRAEIWANRDGYLGKLAKVKSFLIGVKTLPRFPTFLGFRAPEDM